MRPIELRALAELHDGLADEVGTWSSIAITNENSTLAESVAHALSANGCNVQISNSPEALTQQLIVCTALGGGNVIDMHWQALSHAQAFRRAGGKSLILLQDTGGNFAGGPSHGWHGGMAALARTAALEWPDMSVRCIDIAVEPEDVMGTTSRLMKAYAQNTPLSGVDLSGRVCAMHTGELLRQPLHSSSQAETTANDVWIVSGGARGVTAACIEALAQRTGGRFALLGRSVPAEWPSGIELSDDIKELRRLLAARALANGERPVPKDIERIARQALAGQEIRNTVASLEAAGASVRYYPCDISSQQQVNNVVAQIHNELGQITAMVHGAGVLADSNLIDKTREQLDRVFDTKVGGLNNLLVALEGVQLSHIALFSSAAAFYGNTGQGDYAMANEVLNRIAQSLQQRLPEATVKSFNWGPWESGMVDQTLARYFKERGIGLIPVDQGAALFADEMLAGAGRGVELLVGDSWADTSAH